jgi:hypothetical protein
MLYHMRLTFNIEIFQYDGIVHEMHDFVFCDIDIGTERNIVSLLKSNLHV